MKIALVANTSWYLYNFRRNLMRALREEGHEVVAISPTDDYSARFAQEQVTHVHWPLSPARRNPLQEMASVVALRTRLRQHGIQAVLSYTPKGNIYSGLASLGSDRRLLPNISGLGRVFTNTGWLPALVRRLYRVALGEASLVFFQNEEDRAEFVRAGIVSHEKTDRLMGSGVDLQRFQFTPRPDNQSSEGRTTFLLIARMIPEKGVPEFVAAARVIRERHPHAGFQLLGAVSEGDGIPLEQIKTWAAEGIIEYLGTTDDVPSVMAAADCVVLPSYYREGVPRSLIEAAAMGRAIITPDMPGCRDVVEQGSTGWICTPRSVESLVEAMNAFLELPEQARDTMGALGRERAVRLFDERVILARYIDALHS